MPHSWEKLKYKELNWPADHWPQEAGPKHLHDWHEMVARIAGGLSEMIALLEDDNNDLYAPFVWGQGQNLLREALLLADHNAYHTGQIIMVRKLLGSWQ